MPSERIQRRVEAFLDEIDGAAAKADWPTVRDRALAVLGVDPDNEDAKSFLAMADKAEGGAGSRSTPNARDRATVRPRPTEAKPELPASFANGRYAVKKFLGEGGKKKVFLAHDSTLDRDVAFALIKAEGLDDTSRERITREAQSMGRLGDHPNIVPIFDIGQEKDPATGVQQPFMVLPLMTGGDVEGVIEKAPDHRMPLDQVLRIAKDTCEGLVFAHSKGIVHRDLKPGNVMVTDRGVARIADFGLAVATDRSRLTREGMMVGTVSYMPPEQAMGGEITPKADLYSLGAMLYEMVTGRPPFMGDDDIAIIGQHINTPPVAPSWHRTDCPKPLDALIMRLLAKDPKQRPESAADVLSALSAINVTSTASVAPRQARGPEAGGNGVEEGRSLDSVSSGVFVGRQKEMDLLRAAIEETLSGHGRMVTLVGEPGIGKTRTAQELATYAGLRRAQVLWGRCYEGGGAPPYWPWVQAIRSYVLERPPEVLRREMGSTASVIAEVVTDVKERLPGLQPPPPLESPESARFRLFDSITAFFKSASKSQPLVVVLDDLHWSDKPSLLLLEFVARELANSRILVVGTYRDMELNRKHPLALTLGDLARERLFEKVLLRGLQKHDVERFIELAAGVKPPSGLVDAVQSQTEGNPLFVTEVVRLLVQEGHLASENAKEPADTGSSRRQKSTTWTVRIPEGVKEVIGRRLDRLSDRCNDVLTTAAVIERRFSLAALVKLYSDPGLPADERLSEDRLLELMEEALAARIIEELPSGPGRFMFTHALMQETLTSELSATRKVRLHARIALALEGLYGDRAVNRAAELAGHFVEAETVLGTEKIVKYSLIAGERALSSFAHDEALFLFRRALAALGSGPMDAQRAALTAGAATANAALRNVEASLADFRIAFDYYVGAGDIARAAAIAQHKFVSAEGIIGIVPLQERALELVQRDSVSAGLILVRHSRAVGVFQDDYERATVEIARALEIAQHHRDRYLELQAHAAGTYVNQHNLKEDDEVRHALQVVELTKLVDDPLEASFSYGVLARMSAREGNAGQMRTYRDAAIAAASRAQDRERLSTVHMLAANLAANRGEWDEALRFSDISLGFWKDDVRTMGVRALVEFQAGDQAAGDAWLARLRRTAGDSSFLKLFEWAAERITGARRPSESPVAEEPSRPLLMRNAATRASDVVARCCDALTSGDATPDSLRKLNDELVAIDPSYFRRGWILRTLPALLAQLLGDYDRAAAHFEEVMRSEREAGFRPHLAWTCLDYAEMLLERTSTSTAASSQGVGPADWAKAVKLQDEALSIARDLGMKPLVERVIARKKILKA